MRNKNEATLRNHGTDTSKYLSLHIDKAIVPDGAEVVVMVRDASGEQRAIPTINPEPASRYAHNSMFYQRVMDDGYIFNPRIHRRFIAAQFRRLVQQYGYRGLMNGISNDYSWPYAISMLRKEVHTLTSLYKHDANGYAERSRFFTLHLCSRILCAYVDDVMAYMNTQLAKGTNSDVYIPGYGMLKRHNERPMRHRFRQLARNAALCTTYLQLDNLLNAFEWLELPKDVRLPNSFVEPFVEAGAFYTLKHHMMFEGLTLYGKNQWESLNALREHGRSYFNLYQSIM